VRVAAGAHRLTGSPAGASIGSGGWRPARPSAGASIGRRVHRLGRLAAGASIGRRVHRPAAHRPAAHRPAAHRIGRGSGSPDRPGLRQLGRLAARARQFRVSVCPSAPAGRVGTVSRVREGSGAGFLGLGGWGRGTWGRQGTPGSEGRGGAGAWRGDCQARPRPIAVGID
jgi:hypothetical protein